jgi:hypothetical protein
MSTLSPAQRDERTVTVENASYRLAYLFLSYGLLLLVAYRSLVNEESSWDLLLLTILGGVVGTAYQGWHRVLSRQWMIASLSAVVAAGLVAALMVWLRR